MIIGGGLAAIAVCAWVYLVHAKSSMAGMAGMNMPGMDMPGMVMHSGSTIESTGTPGQYRSKVKPDMAGDWMATLHYEGPRGSGSVSFQVNVKP